MSKHTPGPWFLTEDDSPFVYALNEDNTNRFDLGIRRGYERQHGPDRQKTSKEEVMANAKLIAAAPDLLEALIELREASWLNLPGRAGDIIDSAIAKATGES